MTANQDTQQTAPELCGCGNPATDMAHDPWAPGGHPFGTFIASPAAIVAQQLLNHANSLSEEPFAGQGKEHTELGEQFARASVDHLHQFLELHWDDLCDASISDDPRHDWHRWQSLHTASASWDAWQKFGS